MAHICLVLAAHISGLEESRILVNRICSDWLGAYAGVAADFLNENEKR